MSKSQEGGIKEEEQPSELPTVQEKLGCGSSCSKQPAKQQAEQPEQNRKQVSLNAYPEDRKGVGRVGLADAALAALQSYGIHAAVVSCKPVLATHSTERFALGCPSSPEIDPTKDIGDVSPIKPSTKGPTIPVRASSLSHPSRHSSNLSGNVSLTSSNNSMDIPTDVSSMTTSSSTSSESGKFLIPTTRKFNRERSNAITVYPDTLLEYLQRFNEEQEDPDNSPVSSEEGITNQTNKEDLEQPILFPHEVIENQPRKPSVRLNAHLNRFTQRQRQFNLSKLSHYSLSTPVQLSPRGTRRVRFNDTQGLLDEPYYRHEAFWRRGSEYYQPRPWFKEADLLDTSLLHNVTYEWKVLLDPEMGLDWDVSLDMFIRAAEERDGASVVCKKLREQKDRIKDPDEGVEGVKGRCTHFGSQNMEGGRCAGIRLLASQGKHFGCI